MPEFVDSRDKLDFLREQCALAPSSRTPWTGRHMATIAENIVDAHAELNGQRPPAERIPEGENDLQRIERRINEGWRRERPRSPKERQIDRWEAEAICALIRKHKGIEMKPSELSDLPFDTFKERFQVRLRGSEVAPLDLDPIKFLRNRARAKGSIRVEIVVLRDPEPGPSSRLRMLVKGLNTPGPVRPFERVLTPRTDLMLSFGELDRFLQDRNLTVSDATAPHFYAMTLFDQAMQMNGQPFHGYWVSPGPLRQEPRLAPADLEAALTFGDEVKRMQVPAELPQGTTGLVCGIVSERPLLAPDEIEAVLLEPFVTYAQLESLAMRLAAGVDDGHWGIGALDFKIG